jgi:hypothetical protein
MRVNEMTKAAWRTAHLIWVLASGEGLENLYGRPCSTALNRIAKIRALLLVLPGKAVGSHDVRDAEEVGR